MLGNIEIEPSSSMKFLGFTIQSNLGQDLHVNSVAIKIRLAAAQIRADAKNFLTSDRRRLYMGWVQGALCSNGSVYLPLLTQTETDTLQTACNAAIRSIIKLPRKSWDVSISLIRKKMNILSVQDLADKAVLTEAWKSRNLHQMKCSEGPVTRSRSNGNVPHPDQKGWRGKQISTLAKCAFNSLPKDCKETNDSQKAKIAIMNIIKGKKL